MSNLKNLSKDKLIEMINQLKVDNEALKVMTELYKQMNDKIVELERQQNLNLQYLRRDTIEISGIPSSVKQDDLEGEVVKIFDAAKVKVHNKKLKFKNIQACHRIGKKGVTIVKFTNRKFAREAMYCGKNLKDTDLYGGSRVYLNHSFCPEFRFLNYLIRKAKNDGKLFKWKVTNGVNYVQVMEDGDFEEVSHKSDLVSLGIDIDNE